MKSHILTAVLAFVGSLVSVHYLPVDSESPAPAPIVKADPRIAPLSSNVDVLQEQVTTLTVTNRTQRTILARQIRQAAVLSQHVAELEAGTNPAASTIDFQRSISWAAIADELDG